MTPQDDRTPDLPDEDVSRGTADTGDPDRDELELEKRQLRLARIDPDGFEVLYRKYHPRIFRWMVLTLQDRDLARNLTDETFSRAVEGLDRFHWRGVKLGAWLFRIAYNVVGEHFRRSRVRSEVRYDEQAHDRPGPSDPAGDVEAAEDARILMECVGGLDEVRREVIVSHYGTGMKVREIAAVLGMPVATVKSHLQRGREQLRACLEKNGVARGLSEQATRIVRRAAAAERGWDVVGDDDDAGGKP